VIFALRLGPRFSSIPGAGADRLEAGAGDLDAARRGPGFVTLAVNGAPRVEQVHGEWSLPVSRACRRRLSVNARVDQALDEGLLSIGPMTRMSREEGGVALAADSAHGGGVDGMVGPGFIQLLR